MTDLLWTSEALCEAMEAKPVGDVPAGITGISIDSRTIAHGEAYFAIKGDVHDGHKFVASAFAGGGGLSVVSKEWLDKIEGDTGPLLVVDDVLKSLERLGIAARARTDARVIAVTGSVGKTTTKEALRTALEPSGKKGVQENKEGGEREREREREQRCLFGSSSEIFVEPPKIPAQF